MTTTQNHKRSALAEVQFIDELPPAPPRRTVYKVQEASLRDQPGAWALIGHYPNKGSANGCACQRRKQWGDDFEIAVREGDVYARFVGSSNGNGKAKRVSKRSANRTSKRKAKKAEAASAA
jgi:hypothetical protein